MTGSPPAAPGAVSMPLRVQDPAQYARDRAAADDAYARWAAAHPSVFGPALTISTAIPALTKPGMNASVVSGGLTPPDTTGAIGPNYYLEFVNSAIAVYSRGTLASPPVSQAAEDTFVGSSQTCDGQIKWDQTANRWEYWSLDCAAATTSQGYSFGWSKTNNPLPLTGTTANWCRYHVGTSGLLEDYGKLGNSNGYLIMGMNEFNMSAGGSYTQSPIYVWPKPANGATTCPTESGWKFNVSPAGSDFTPEPANVFGSSLNGFVASLSDFSHLQMFTVKPPLTGSTTPQLISNGTVAVPTFGRPAAVPQPGSTDKLDPLDGRLTQAVAVVDPVLKVFAVWTQHTIAGAQGGPDVVRWYEVKGGVSQAAPVQTGTISVSGAFAFNGAISPTAQGSAAAIDYNVGSSTLKVQVRARDRLPGAAAGTMGNETVLASSAGIQADFSCPSKNGGASSSCRWGDYAGASPDPTCRGQVWGTDEWNGTNSGSSATWATQNFRLAVRTCPTASFTVTPTSPVHGSAATFNGSASTTPNGTIVSYRWVFGDGTSATTTTATTTHTYTTAGTKKPTLTVTDSAGLTGSVTKAITVT